MKIKQNHRKNSLNQLSVTPLPKHDMLTVRAGQDEDTGAGPVFLPSPTDIIIGVVTIVVPIVVFVLSEPTPPGLPKTTPIENGFSR